MCSSSAIPCPLCSQPAFANLNSLRHALISVATRHLMCPVCAEILLGLDKLTIHLFGHLHTIVPDTKPAMETPLLITVSNQSPLVNSSKDIIKNIQFTNNMSINNEASGVISSNQIQISQKPLNLFTYQNFPHVQVKTPAIQFTQEMKPHSPVKNMDLEINNNNSVNKTNSQNWLKNYQTNPLRNTEENSSEKKNVVITSKTERVFACEICAFKFNTKQILEMHKNLVHSKVVQDGAQKSYPCHLCSKKFRMRGSLMVHLRVVHYGFPNLIKHNLNQLTQNLTCNICNKVFSKHQQLVSHLKTHENKQWECEVCSKMFTTKYFLKKHNRLHTGEMPYYCNQCDKAFTFQQSYHKHMLYHSSEKPHTCSQCGRAFKELSTLHNHERIHSGERPFSCETCGKCFRQRVSCLVHKRIHTGVMPYQCNQCGKKFRYKVSQRTHKCTSQSTSKPEKNDFSQPSPTACKTPTLSSSQVQTFSPQGSPLMQPKPDSPPQEPVHTDFVPFKPIQSIEVKSNTSENLEVIKSTDFFSLVLSPMDVSSPSDKFKNLCLSNSDDKITLPADTIFENVSSTPDFIENNENILRSDPLQTINEESLKQLLYGSTNTL